MITEKLLSQIRAHTSVEYPNEACGLVVVKRGKAKYLPCKNIAASKQEHFIISAEDYADAEDQGKIAYIVHSHPNAPHFPSEGDKVGIEASGIPWLIVNEPTGSYGVYEPIGYEAPLVGRQYHHGVLDCYSIIVDYYKRELDIELPDFDRSNEWWLSGGNMYVENFEKAGFVRVLDPPRQHDVLLMQIASPVPNHGAIFLGDGTILQHCANRLSSKDVWGGAWQRATTHVLRHVTCLEK